MKICPKCQLSHDDSAKFCQSCGSSLDSTTNIIEDSIKKSNKAENGNVISTAIFTFIIFIFSYCDLYTTGVKLLGLYFMYFAVIGMGTLIIAASLFWAIKQISENNKKPVVIATLIIGIIAACMLLHNYTVLGSHIDNYKQIQAMEDAGIHYTGRVKFVGTSGLYGV